MLPFFTPSAQKGPFADMDHVSHLTSPLGNITLTADDLGLTGLWFDDQKYFGRTLSPDARETPDLPFFRLAAQWLDCFFAGHDPGFTPPLHMKTTPFRKRVWTLLLDIPWGQTRSYGQIAAAVASAYGIPRVSPRAVGGAAAHNDICLIVPCHRVLAASGALTGYAGGLDRKARLLALEAASPPDRIPELLIRKIESVCGSEKCGKGARSFDERNDIE